MALSPNPTKLNVLANLFGQGWSGLVALIFVPFYVHFLGMESFGLIGFFATLQASLAPLDLGLSTAINRELARLSSPGGDSQKMRDLVRTTEVIYAGVAILIGGVVILLAPWIAFYWVNAAKLPLGVVEEATLYMGMVLALQWPLAFYSGGMLGLQQHVLLNVIKVVMMTLRSGGVVLVLWLVNRTIQGFFLWQVLVAGLHTGLLAFCLWRSLPAGNQPVRFRKELLLGIWRFAAGMSGISVLALLLTQLDKIILSKILPLEQFGYYSLASMVAAALLTNISSPIFTGLFPRFSQLVMTGDREELKNLYHRGCQLMSVLVLPISVMIALFSHSILVLWTGDANTAEQTWGILGLLIAGGALNSLNYLPYGLQLAHGWTSLSFYTNLGATILLGPLIVWMAWLFGPVGPATVWVIIQGGCTLVGWQVMYRYLLPGEQWRWCLEDVALPLGGSLLVGGIGRLLLQEWLSGWALLLSLAGVTAGAFAAAMASAPWTRTLLIDQIKRIVNWKKL